MLGEQLRAVVLADIAEPGGYRGLDGIGTEALGDGDDAHRSLRSSSLGDPALDLGQPLLDLGRAHRHTTPA
jgi:hypothetical protein